MKYLFRLNKQLVESFVAAIIQCVGLSCHLIN